MRKRYIVFNPTTGDILRTVRCLEDQVEGQAQEGEAIMEAPDNEGSPRSHYVEMGALVAKPPRPSTDTVWDGASRAWVDPRPLAVIKLAQADALRDAAKAAAVAPLTIQGVTFTVSEATRAELAAELALAQAEGAGYSLEWERADGTPITLTGPQVRGLLRAISTRGMTTRAALRAKLQAVQAATSKAEVKAVTW